jgi:hypothetical protein
MEEVGESLDRSVLGPIMDVSERMNIVQVVHGDMVPFYYGVSPFIKNMVFADAALTDGGLAGNDGVIRKRSKAAAVRPMPRYCTTCPRDGNTAGPRSF